MIRRFHLPVLAASVVLIWACSERSVTGAAALAPGQGRVSAMLTDAPVPFDSVKEVNVFIEQIDARRARADSADADHDIDGDHDDDHMRNRGDSTLWVTIAMPNKTFNLLDLQNGVTAFLGTAAVDTGNFRAFRIVIDPSKSNIVLKDGTVLNDSTGVEFERARRHGILVELNDTLDVKRDSTATIVLDFRLDQSITLRGRTVHDGFFFRPVVTGRCDHDGDHGGDGHQ